MLPSQQEESRCQEACPEMEPFVSIIVPVKNEERRLPRLLEALQSLDYPRDRYEIIVADNGSSDETPVIAERREGVVVCKEPRGGSYAARNAGIRASRGEILAFTDGDCTPRPEWLRCGVARLQEGSDLVAGAINFVVSKDRIDHRFDKKFFLQQDRWVKEKGTGATANLLVKRAVVDAVGGFSEKLTSGGDFAFCRAAKEAGFSLVFEPQAIVDHPTRGFMAILKKARRIGGGKVERLRHTATKAGDVIPGKKQLSTLVKGEPLLTRIGFFGLYVAVFIAGAYGAVVYLARQACGARSS